MKARPIPPLSSRKLPRQARSTRLVADVLEAAAHVLARDGAHRFTTTRVAERAGVSVGSLYQYFPNKEAILFRLQTDEWKQTGDLLGNILADRTHPPFDRLRAAIRAFFRSEVAEAPLRVALGDAAPFHRDAPESREQRKAGTKRVLLFMREAAPGVPRRTLERAVDMMMMSMESVGKRISEDGRSPAEVDDMAAAMGDMFCAYLDRMVARNAKAAPRRTAAASG